MSDDVRDRAQKIIEECEYQFSAMRQDARAAEVIAALDAAGIALVDAELATWCRERIAQQREEIERLEDERRRLLAFRDAYERQHRLCLSNSGSLSCRVAGQDYEAARAAVADIEAE